MVAKNLTSALKDGPLLYIPDQNLKSKINLLYDIFKEIAKNIVTCKLSPIQKESVEELSSINITKKSTIKPRVEEIDQRPRVVSNQIKDTLELSYIM